MRDSKKQKIISKHFKGLGFDEIAEILSDSITNTLDECMVIREQEIWQEVVDEIKKGSPFFALSIESPNPGSCSIGSIFDCFSYDGLTPIDNYKTLNEMMKTFIEDCDAATGVVESIKELADALLNGAKYLEKEYKKRNKTVEPEIGSA